MVKSEWQPIETAPKDGTPVLLYVVQPKDDWYSIDILELTEDMCTINIGAWENGQFQTQFVGTPTHWMRLPPAPLTGGRENG